MKLLIPILLSLTVLTLPLIDSAASKTEIAPEEWLPALFPSIEFALQQLKEADSQAAMNALSRQVAEMKDAQLYIAYVRLYQRLSTKEQTQLLAEQTSWLKKRAKAAKDAIESEGGSLAALEANDAELDFTEQRLRELRKRLKAITNKDE